MTENLVIKTVVNATVLKDRLKDIHKGMEDYRKHKNMTWLKHKVKSLIEECGE